MKHIICMIFFIALTDQISTMQSDSPWSIEIDLQGKASIKDMLDSKIKDERNFESNRFWLADHPNKEEMIKNYKAWSACVHFKRTETECAPLFEILGTRGQSIMQKVISYLTYVSIAASDHDKCRESNRTEHDCNLEKADWERILSEIKSKGFPWPELYELCMSTNTESFCESYIAVLDHLLKPAMKLVDIGQVMRLSDCVNAEPSGEKCLVDWNIIFVDKEDEEGTVDMDKRDVEEL